MSLWITKIVVLFLLNAAALYVAVYFVDVFEIIGGRVEFAVVAAIFTLINFFIKPVVKLVLSPVIIITLGLGLVFVNAVMLYFLDFVSDSVIINGTIPLIYATVVISVVHFALGFFMRRVVS